jgi:hypothetical protein
MEVKEYHPKEQQKPKVTNQRSSLPSLNKNRSQIENSISVKEEKNDLNRTGSFPNIHKRGNLSNSQASGTQNYYHSNFMASQRPDFGPSNKNEHQDYHRKEQDKKATVVEPATTRGSVNKSVNELTDTSGLGHQEGLQNKYYKRKPFSWMTQGSFFNMLDPNTLYLTSPSESMELTGRIAKKKLSEKETSQLQSTKYSTRKDQNYLNLVPKENSYLQIREPYFLQSPADFYKKVVPPRDPPQQRKPLPITIKRQMKEKIEPSEITKYILLPENEMILPHKKGDREMVAADFTYHQLSMYQPLRTKSDKDLYEVNDVGEKAQDSDSDDRAFKSVIVQKYVFDTSKKELEAIKKLIVHYEANDPKLIKNTEKTLTSEEHGQDAIGYSKRQFEKENEIINLFLVNLNDQNHIEDDQLRMLKSIVHKRLALISQILSNLDYSSKIKKYIKKKEDNYLEYLNAQNAKDNQLTLVGVRTGENLSSWKKSKTKGLKKLRKNDFIKNIKKQAEDSSMESESSSDEVNRERLKYEKVLSKKINIDKQKFHELCMNFIKKEVKRIKHVIQINEARRKALPNPNRDCKTAMGFSENLMNLIKKNKEFLPADIKMDLLKIMPLSDLKELGNDLFIDDELTRRELLSQFSSKGDALKHQRDELNKDSSLPQELEGKELEEATLNFEQLAIQLNRVITEMIGEDDVLKTEPNHDGSESQKALKRLATLEVKSLSREQKRNLRNRGLVISNGRILLKDNQGNTLDTITMKIEKSKSQIIRESPQQENHEEGQEYLN